MAYYRDLREYIDVLAQQNRLVKIKRVINKDTELMPLVRWQFRGLDEKDRKAFLFENVTDIKGNRYQGSVLVGSHAASREVYALAMSCEPADIMPKWEQAQLKPVPPVMAKSGPVQEEVHVGDKLLEHGGLEEFAVPISTPGFDNAPYFSAGNFVTKDPDTGIRNVGNYRAMVKSPTGIGVRARMPQHARLHWQKYKQRGIPMPAACVIGPTPNIGLVAVIKIPYGVDEYDVAGGISGEPVELVKCQTVDLEVPAASEIVIEGEIPTDCLEREGPFGEFTGYMGFGGPNLFLKITGITHRIQPVWNAYLSQFPPSESSLITCIGQEAAYYKLLKHDLGIASVEEVAFHEESGGRTLCVIRLKNSSGPEVWQALYGANAATAYFSKIIIAVDDDIDPRDMDSVAWALCFRMQPHRDIQIARGKHPSLDPSVAPPGMEQDVAEPPTASAIMIDATRKWAYPPTSLPEKKFMEKARQIWEEEGLPSLRPKMPWHGSSFGYWPVELAEEAELAIRGEYYQTGKKLAQNRVKA
ncbi:UbiD family decarboxylase [Chloroflexota bacterium]